LFGSQFWRFVSKIGWSHWFGPLVTSAHYGRSLCWNECSYPEQEAENELIGPHNLLWGHTLSDPMPSVLAPNPKGPQQLLIQLPGYQTLSHRPLRHAVFIKAVPSSLQYKAFILCVLKKLRCNSLPFLLLQTWCVGEKKNVLCLFLIFFRNLPILLFYFIFN
jgi:hypothetical protein